MRLIDADALEKDANDDLFDCPDTEEEVYWNDGAKSIIDLIKTAPTIDLVRHGKWICVDGKYYCSECDEEQDWKTYYCSGCGAKMDGGEG